ncbi:hypothetical protein M1555_03345 [Patescibacteria group bacterium]|nr:hypothetical protein [Patescibacteria group bacterium]
MVQLFGRITPKVTSVVSFIAILIFLPLLLLATYQTVTLISRAAGVPASIIVDTKSSLEPITTDFYHAFAQGGEEATNMLAPVESEVKSLHPGFIRIDHIYDLYHVVGKSGSDLTFDWTKLDETVDTIRATGATPMLSLSYMPEAIARGGSIINPPTDWNDWALVVERTIEHFSGKGNKNLSNVHYEVWNEPDLAQFGKWGLSGDKNYLTLYRYAALGAGRAEDVNRFALGGPATAGLYKNWILALVRSGNRLDFLSWHSYLPNPKQFDDDQRNIISWLLPYPRYTLIPKMITEFGFSGDKSTLYGSPYAAAYTAAVIRELISQHPAYLFSFQLKDGPGQESGNGWGLITHESNGAKAKPRYWVYDFIDRMAGTRLALSGEGSWVTAFATKKDGTYRILLVNFDASGRHVETVPVTFANLDPGTYTYRERQLFGRTVETHDVVAGSVQDLQKMVYMPAQSVMILELTKTDGSVGGGGS